MWPVLKLLLLQAICSAQRGVLTEGKQTQQAGHVSVVIVGGTGDLAKKYLWQGFFQLYTSQAGSGHTFSFYGGGLSPDDQGTPVLFDILKHVACSPDTPVERCALLKDQFLHLVQYRQLKTPEDYRALGRHIQETLQGEGMVEAGRLFYLSVPAFAYADIADQVNSSCRPAGGAWLRVVLEKPFGHDLSSAQTLATQLGGSLKDEEMYRIDHYLGKQVRIRMESKNEAHGICLNIFFIIINLFLKVVSNILPFRKVNQKFLDPIWNRQHIERVEIVLKETLDVKGDKYTFCALKAYLL